MTQRDAHFKHPLVAEWKAWALGLAGVVMALYVFMEDEIRVACGGEGALRTVLRLQKHQSQNYESKKLV